MTSGKLLLGTIGGITSIASVGSSIVEAAAIADKNVTRGRIVEILARTVQAAVGAFFLVSATAMVTTPMGFAAALSIGVVLVLSPGILAIARRCAKDNKSLVQKIDCIDRIMNITIKIISSLGSVIFASAAYGPFGFFISFLGTLSHLSPVIAEKQRRELAL